MPDKFLTNHFIQRVFSTLPDRLRKSVSIIDRFELSKGVLAFRGIEAGPGIKLDVADCDGGRLSTPQTKIIVEAFDTAFGGPPSPVVQVTIPATDGQTVFPLPQAYRIVGVTINGIGTDSWEHLDNDVIFKPELEGYALDHKDTVEIFYHAKYPPYVFADPVSVPPAE